MQTEEHHVFFTAASTSLDEALQHLEPWLDRNDIRPIGTNHMVVPSGAIELQLTFKTRHEASLFERAFCQDEVCDTGIGGEVVEASPSMRSG